MDESAIKRVDRLVQWIKAHRKDLCTESGEVSSSELARVEGLSSNPSYWSEVLRKVSARAFAASSARKTETALGMPHLLLEGSGWPFEEVDFERWERLSERQKGLVERAVNDELDRIEDQQRRANSQ